MKLTKQANEVMNENNDSNTNTRSKPSSKQQQPLKAVPLNSDWDSHWSGPLTKEDLSCNKSSSHNFCSSVVNNYLNKKINSWRQSVKSSSSLTSSEEESARERSRNRKSGNSWLAGSKSNLVIRKKESRSKVKDSGDIGDAIWWRMKRDTATSLKTSSSWTFGTS